MKSVGCRAAWVYPRGCGGASNMASRIQHGWGLSPRVRGSHCIVMGDALCYGSIPAGAGEPMSSPMLSARPGLSPRVRGSPLHMVRLYG